MRVWAVIVFAMLAQPSYWWFKLNDHCYIRTPAFPESLFFQIPCEYLEDITIPKQVIDDYLEQCDKDDKCIRWEA